MRYRLLACLCFRLDTARSNLAKWWWTRASLTMKKTDGMMTVTSIYQYLPDTTLSHCPWWPDRAESFNKNLFKSPIFPQVAIKFILKHFSDVEVTIRVSLVYSANGSSTNSKLFSRVHLKISVIARLLSDAAAKTLVQAFVSRRLDYCNALLCGISDGLIRRLQSVQNAA